MRLPCVWKGFDSTLPRHSVSQRRLLESDFDYFPQSFSLGSKIYYFTETKINVFSQSEDLLNTPPSFLEWCQKIDLFRIFTCDSVRLDGILRRTDPSSSWCWQWKSPLRDLIPKRQGEMWQECEHTRMTIAILPSGSVSIQHCWSEGCCYSSC